jgi:hypothetical protein
LEAFVNSSALQVSHERIQMTSGQHDEITEQEAEVDGGEPTAWETINAMT